MENGRRRTTLNRFLTISRGPRHFRQGPPNEHRQHRPFSNTTLHRFGPPRSPSPESLNNLESSRADGYFSVTNVALRRPQRTTPASSGGYTIHCPELRSVDLTAAPKTSFQVQADGQLSASLRIGLCAAGYGTKRHRCEFAEILSR